MPDPLCGPGCDERPSDSDLDLIDSLIAQAGFRALPVYEHSILIESFIIYELIQKSEIGNQSFLTSVAD